MLERLPSERAEEDLEQRLSEEQYENPIVNILARRKFYKHAEEPRDFLAETVAIVQPSDTDVILDVGSSIGSDLARLRREFDIGAALVGLEKAESVFEQLGYFDENEKYVRSRDGSISFMRGDARQIPLADNSIDLVLASRMIYHVPKPQKALEEFHRVLRPGGVLALTTTGKGNKHEHRKFEKAIARHLGIERPPNFAKRFRAEQAAKVLPKLFQIVDGSPSPQITPAHFDTTTLDDFLNSLLTMKPSFDPRPNAESWEETIQEVVMPKILGDIATNGHFTDRINQWLFLYRKSA